jgi:hypothetical protein
MLKIGKTSVDYKITLNIRASSFSLAVEYVLFDGVRLQAVDADLHLGFQLGPNVHQKRIDQRINDLCRNTINMVMAQIGHADVANRYFPAMSLYGQQFWDLTGRGNVYAKI